MFDRSTAFAEKYAHLTRDGFAWCYGPAQVKTVEQSAAAAVAAVSTVRTEVRAAERTAVAAEAAAAEARAEAKAAERSTAAQIREDKAEMAAAVE